MMNNYSHCLNGLRCKRPEAVMNVHYTENSDLMRYVPKIFESTWTITDPTPAWMQSLHYLVDYGSSSWKSYWQTSSGLRDDDSLRVITMSRYVTLILSSASTSSHDVNPFCCNFSEELQTKSLKLISLARGNPIIAKSSANVPSR